MATINIHNVESMTAEQSGAYAWIRITGKKDDVVIHCDYRLAERIADAFKDYHDWLSGQETGEIK